MKRFSLIFIYILAAIAMAQAQVQFTIVPPRNVVEGDKFNVVYKVVNGDDSPINAPEITNGCKLLYPGGVSHFNANLNGTIISEVSYSYTYRAEKAGKYTIPAATVKVGGKTYTAQSVTFEVLPPGKSSGNGSASPRTQSNNQSSNRSGTIEPREARRNESFDKNYVFVRIIPNKSTVYEQEPIECSVKLYTRNPDIQMLPMTTTPSYDGFIVEEIDLPTVQLNLEHYNGDNYYTATIRKFILIPQKAGKSTITTGEFSVVAQIDEYYNYGGMQVLVDRYQKRIEIAPATFTANVKPLPEPRPAGFNGAVGKYTFSADINPKSLRTGEAASLTMTIEGSGNIKFIKAPEINFPPQLQKYSENITSDASIKGSTFSGKTIIEVPFVAEVPGTFTIDPIEFVYFNPSTAEYNTISSESFEIEVVKGLGTSTGTSQQDIKVENSDIRYIHTGDKNLEKNPVVYASTWQYWLLYPAIALLGVAAVMFAMYRGRKSADVAGTKMSKARKNALRHINAASTALKKNDMDRFYESTLKGLWGYLSDKFAIPASELKRDNVVELLDARGVSQEDAESYIAIIDQCEMARYTPQSLLDEPATVLDNARSAIRRLDSASK